MSKEISVTEDHCQYNPSWCVWSIYDDGRFVVYAYNYFEEQEAKDDSLSLGEGYYYSPARRCPKHGVSLGPFTQDVNRLSNCPSPLNS